MATSLPISARRLARSRTSSVTWMCWSGGLSNVEYTTSAAWTVRCQSVTSSGRSSTSSTITCVSGLEVRMPFAMFLSTVVLPALGGETTIPRWPLPIGATMSMIRPVTSFGAVSRWNRSCGNSGVSFSKTGRCLAVSGSTPFTVSIWSSAKYFSLSLGERTLPVTTSPLRSMNRRTCDSDT